VQGSGNSDERFQVVTISFKPEVMIAENDTVAIVGEFTNWMPAIMERHERERVLLEPELVNTFFYSTKLFRGFKYRYYFSVGDQFTVDTTKETSQDRFGRMTNSVDVPLKNEKEAEEGEHDLEATLDELAAEDDFATVSSSSQNANVMTFMRYPSYIDKEMKNVLPKDIQ